MYQNRLSICKALSVCRRCTTKSQAIVTPLMILLRKAQSLLPANTPVLARNKADESAARNAQPCLVSNSSASFLFPPLYLIQISHIPTHHPPILLLQGLLGHPKAPILIQ